MDLTIDINVLMSGSGTGDPLHKSSSLLLMNNMLIDGEFFLCVDKRGRILNQYNTKMKNATFFQYWLKEIYSNSKLKIVIHNYLSRGTITKLSEARFNCTIREDLKYVETAAATDSKLLISHDPDYNNRVCKILKKELTVSVFGAKQLLHAI